MSEKPDLKRFLATAEPAALGPQRRRQAQSQAVLEEQLMPLLKSSALSGERQELIRALILLWHDHLDAAHKIAQDVDTADGAFVHGMMHRREPDFGNAAYWFRRVGRHPAYKDIARCVAPVLESAFGRDFSDQLIRNGEWEPFAFIAACEQTSGTSGPRELVLREVQRVEFNALLDWFQRN